MAKAVTVVSGKPDVALTLTWDEARTLRGLLGQCIVGSGSDLELLSGIWDAIKEAGVDNKRMKTSKDQDRVYLE